MISLRVVWTVLTKVGSWAESYLGFMPPHWKNKIKSYISEVLIGNIKIGRIYLLY